MAIFPSLVLEDKVQVFDKTRLDASKSFISKDEAAITLVRIKPESTGIFITVTGTKSADWYLDWSYQTDGTKTVTCEITSNGSPVTFTKNIIVVTSVNDGLWSSDQDLVLNEPEILKWIPVGRNSYLNIHRKSQSLILDWLASKRMFKNDGTRLNASDVSITNEIKLLSIYWTLNLIFESISNKQDDVFSIKSKFYNGKVLELKNSGQIKADFNGDGTISTDEVRDNLSYRMSRS